MGNEIWKTYKGKKVVLAKVFGLRTIADKLLKTRGVMKNTKDMKGQNFRLFLSTKQCGRTFTIQRH